MRSEVSKQTMMERWQTDLGRGAGQLFAIEGGLTGLQVERKWQG